MGFSKDSNSKRYGNTQNKKITLNVGLGEAVGDKKVVEKAVVICLDFRPKPVVNLARKSIAALRLEMAGLLELR